jgi:hypothetical protein
VATFSSSISQKKPENQNQRIEINIEANANLYLRPQKSDLLTDSVAICVVWPPPPPGCPVRFRLKGETEAKQRGLFRFEAKQ